MNGNLQIGISMHVLAVAAVAFAAVLGIAPVAAQQTSGVPGSPSATTTIDGKQLPPPPEKFGGVIKESASDSKPFWAIDESFDIGSDTRTGVDDSYKLPFRFSGTINKLTYKLGQEQLTAEEEATMRKALAKARD